MDISYKGAFHSSDAPAMAKNNREKILYILAHILVWSIFLSIPAMFNPRRSGMGISRVVVDMMEPPRWLNAILLIIVFYFNSYFAIPKLYFRRKYIALIGWFLLSFILFYELNDMIAPDEVRASPFFTPLGNSFNLFMFIIVYAFSFVICLYQQYHKIKEEKLTTKISFLTAQINPHFLFNTLNSIYSLSLTKSDKVPDAIVKLSGMMRYSVSEGNQSKVPLSKELNYIRNYVELQRLRLTEEVNLQLQVNGSASNIQIAPFLLIPFIENAFKHGINGEDNTEISIIINIQPEEFSIAVSNTKVQTRLDREAGVGLGIKTTKQRLELLYPGKHQLHIQDKEHNFTVTLQIHY